MNWYFLNRQGIDNSWFTDGNWSNTDGGAPVSGYPNGDTEDAFFTANSRDCYWGSINIAVRHLDFTGYTGIFTMDIGQAVSYAIVSLHGNLILSQTMKIIAIGLAGFRFNTGLPGIGQTIKTNGITVPYAQFQVRSGNDGVVTLLDTLNASIIQMVTFPVTIAGNYGFVTKTLKHFITPSSTPAKFILQAGIEYIITDLFIDTHSRSISDSYESSTPGTKAFLTVRGNVQLGYTNFTDIDASRGRSIATFNGTVTNCTNIYSFTDKPIVTTSSMKMI